jgi:hypothetical protein
MVECRDCGGGSGIFTMLGLFTFESDSDLRHSDDGTLTVENRILLKILGVLHLGDRYYGSVVYKNGTLMVGPDVGHFARGDSAIQAITVE